MGLNESSMRCIVSSLFRVLRLRSPNIAHDLWVKMGKYSKIAQDRQISLWSMVKKTAKFFKIAQDRITSRNITYDLWVKRLLKFSKIAQDCSRSMGKKDRTMSLMITAILGPGLGLVSLSKFSHLSYLLLLLFVATQWIDYCCFWDHYQWFRFLVHVFKSVLAYYNPFTNCDTFLVVIGTKMRQLQQVFTTSSGIQPLMRCRPILFLSLIMAQCQLTVISLLGYQ